MQDLDPKHWLDQLEVTGPIKGIMDFVDELSRNYDKRVAALHIDFQKGKISLIDDVGAKKWVFAEREIEYMQGWRDILDAMKYAIDQAEEELKAFNQMMANRNSF